MAPLPELLRQFSWREFTHHPWRNAAAVVAVMLGVALAFAVHLINASALSEFSQAVRAVNGQPDLEVRAVQGHFDEALYGRLARHPDVAVASPVLEITSMAAGPQGQRSPVRVLGLDALVAATVSPALLPRPAEGADRFALFAPATVFLNPAARTLVGAGATALSLQCGLAMMPMAIAGTVAAGGGPLVVMDLGAAQDAFDRGGQLSRIDLQLRPGVDRPAFVAAILSALDWPANVVVSEPGDDAQRVSNLSRAYRVNLTVLALVALFTGAFLVFSVLSLSVAKRAPQFALLAVLGLTRRERLALVLAESAALGLLGSTLGIALGGGLAWAALTLLGGDLGGGYFAGVAPTLQWDSGAALVYGGLGLVAALLGGWWPARAAQALPPAATLKGLGAAQGERQRGWPGPVLMAAGALLALLPPVAGVPLAAYLAVALLLLGGITALPWAVGALYDALSPWVADRLLPLLAVERARRVRHSAAVAVSGVVAALSLAVALTVMVASFRESVSTWLDRVLPADLYARSASAAAASDTVYFGPALLQTVGQLPGVARWSGQRNSQLLLDPTRPPVALLARPLDRPERDLALVGPALPVPTGQVGIYVSEAMVELYQAQPGRVFPPLARPFQALAGGTAPPPAFFVAGVWRDYARQFGAIALAQADFQRLTGDDRVNDLALWLADGADAGAVQQGLRDAAEAHQPGAGALIEFASAREIRALSLRIFDRSFAVTYWLQGVAIAIGLFGVAASFSAQVLARRKEFGLLAHLGLTRRQILAVVAGEGAAWTTIGALAGLGLGLAVAVVLVHVVNPQSFHWTMDLALPVGRLLALGAAVVLAGTATAWLAGRAAAGRQAVLAVKEDW